MNPNENEDGGMQPGQSFAPSNSPGSPSVPAPEPPQSELASTPEPPPLGNESESSPSLVVASNAPANPPSPSVAAAPPLTPSPPTPATNPTPDLFLADSVPPPSPKFGKLKLGLAVLAVVVLLVAGYVFAIYLPNTPSNVYSSSLKNSGLAVDQLVDYVKKQDTTKYESSAYSGKINFKSDSGSFDGEVTGAADKSGNSSTHLNIDAMGEKLSGDLRTIKVKGSSSPDAYFRVAGIKHILDSYSLKQYDNLDSQWIVADHTLLDSAAKQAAQSEDPSAASDNFKAPTPSQINDAVTKVQQVNKQYIFTSKKDKAVLTNEKFIGKEELNGRKAYHYKVGYDKAHLNAYLDALKGAILSSQLNDWYKQSSHGKGLESVIDLTGPKNSIKKGSPNYTFDLWADSKTKLVSAVRFTDSKDKNSTLTIGQNYTGGGVYPFSISTRIVNDDKSIGSVELNFKIDSKANSYTLDVSGDKLASAKGPSLSAHFSLTPSRSLVKVTAPKGAKPVIDVLGQLGLNESASPQPGKPAAASPIPFLLNQ